MTARVHDAHTTQPTLGTYYAHPRADTLYLAMLDTIDELVMQIREGHRPESGARALRDLITHDLPIAIRQVERDSCEHALADIERLAKEHKDVADKQHLDQLAAFVASGADLCGLVTPIKQAGVEHGMQTAVKFEARRRNQIRVGKLPRRLRTRRT